MNEWLNWVMGLLTLVAGGGWLFDRKRHRQEVESIRADNRQKDLDLSKDYVESFRKEIADPLRREVRELKKEVKKLNNAIGKIQDGRLTLCGGRSMCRCTTRRRILSTTR